MLNWCINNIFNAIITNTIAAVIITVIILDAALNTPVKLNKLVLFDTEAALHIFDVIIDSINT